MTYKVFKRGNFVVIESSNNRDVWEVSANKMVISRASNVATVYNFYDNGNSILSNIALSFLTDESGTAYSESNFENFRTTECGYEILDIDSIVETVENDLNSPIIDVDLCCQGNLTNYVYVNGTAGVGATLTAPANGAFPTQDGGASALGKLYLVKFQTNKRHNGVYELTTLGNGSTKAKLTRAANADQTNELYPLKVFISSGAIYNNLTFAQKTVDPVIGTDLIVFQQTRTSTTAATPSVSLCDTVTTANIAGTTYTDGTLSGFPGFGASLTKAGAFPTINSVTPFIDMVILFKDFSGAEEYKNGLYKLVLDNGTSWKAVRTGLYSSNINKKVVVVSNSTCGDYGRLYSCDNTDTLSTAIGTDAISFTEMSGGTTDTNFANTDLTLPVATNRLHNLNGNLMTFDNAELKIIADADTSGDLPFYITKSNGSTDIFRVTGEGCIGVNVATPDNSTRFRVEDTGSKYGILAATAGAPAGYFSSTGHKGVYSESGGLYAGHFVATGTNIYAAILADGNGSTGNLALQTNGKVKSVNLPTYADNAAALLGGLVADEEYKTATGERRIVV